MLEMLRHAHSGFRWIVLLLLVVSIVNAFFKWRSKKTYTGTDRKINLFTMISVHIQLLIGIFLYVLSPKVQFTKEAMGDSVLRFFTAEHSVSMVIAIILITIGFIRTKRLEEDVKKFRSIFIFYFVALLLILLMIPYPFQNYGASWF